MKREQLEHLLRASANVLNDWSRTKGKREFVVLGSQSILGQHPDAPVEVLRSMEADVYPRSSPELAEVLDGALGELSPFHDTHGYYAQGVGPETAVLPVGWEDRLVRIDTPSSAPGVGLCLDAHDLAIAKYVAGRTKDLEFTAQLAHHGLTRRATLMERLAATKVPSATRRLVEQRIASHFRTSRS